ncbi:MULTISPECIES: methionine--tRNA ligase [Hallerella]|uniref:Methionine--tRNA ligase n=1 Tax=Hallerella succinigenes TaxID=1896222 RepID=A0A2M9A9X4_9BACT|nr:MULTISPECIES: methionine--tRNA ligase [Hallerella]MCI6874224.1 methionine--tRNA ligase [Hallerella sp.]MDY5029381.1 methionine--tRNA ligase [Hallerella succinigenes]PJJ42541.1 methionyl-tRNA synthetase [Hallerella succinigenes]
MKNFYVTTPIYYVNDAPHIGHSYTTVLADILTRFHKILGYQTYFLTGTDEHGQKVQRAAEKRGVTPQEHVDEYYHRFEDLWKKMDIGNDFFIRTTMPEHKAYVQECLQKLWDKGEIYSKEYEGWYSVGEERFFTEDELDENKCDPISHRPVEWLKEKNYFFKMGSYQQKLIDFLESHKDWIVPDYRWNEIRGFLKQPLNDLCISRPKARLSWGIPLPFDTDYVTYVWFDALLNYVSASTAFHKTYADGTPIWPATYHLIGKDILTTHCVYWPTMLMALDIPLPEHVLAHGWWLVNGGEKMSKSAGNVVNPMDYMEKYGIDAFRYFLAREMVVGQDANFTHEGFVRRINSDLANDLGNVLNRVHRLVLNNFEGKLPKAAQIGEAEKEVIDLAGKVIAEIKEGLPKARLSQSIETIMQLVRSINRYLEVKAPWKLAKDESKKDELATVLYISAEAVRLSLCLLWPVIPSKAEEGLAMLGSKFQSAEDLSWGVLQSGETFGEGKPLFPRIEEEKKQEQAKPVQKPKQNKPLTAEEVPAEMDIRAAKIIDVQNHPDADSLYVLQVDAGEGEPRTICSGLRASYKAEELKDRMIVLFANLKPAPLRGIMSNGMLFAGDTDEEHVCVLIAPPEDAKPGDRATFHGIAPATDGRILKVKDFEKISLEVRGKVVFCGENALEIGDKPVTCDVLDGKKVH